MSRLIREEGRFKLREILGDTDARIEYRTFGPRGEDVFAGVCYYINGELTSLDGDNYSLDDELVFYRYEMLDVDNRMRNITVWY